MNKLGLMAYLRAKAGKENEVEEFLRAAQKLAAHERMELGVLIDRPVNANEQSLGLELREVRLKIQARPRSGLFFVATHLIAPVATSTSTPEPPKGSP